MRCGRRAHGVMMGACRTTPRSAAAPGEGAQTRIEHDTMGEVEVPADALWGAQTARAVANLPLSGQRMPLRVVHALALVKGAAAATNAELGVLDRDLALAVVAAARRGGAGPTTRTSPSTSSRPGPARRRT